MAIKRRSSTTAARGTKSAASTTRSASRAMKISGMEAGEVFHFESAKSPENSGPYIKADSDRNKAFGLMHFRTLQFAPTDTGVVIDGAELKIPE